MATKFEVEDILALLEGFLKTGRLSFQLLSFDEKDKAVTNELVVQYPIDPDTGAKLNPKLWIKGKDNVLRPIEADNSKAFREFANNILDVGKTRTKTGEPCIFFKLYGDVQDDYVEIGNFFEGKAKNELYEELKDETNCIPCVTHVFIDGKEYKVIPYVTSSYVLVDMTDLGNTSTENVIDSLENVMRSIWGSLKNLATKISEGIDTYTSINEAMYVDLKNRMNELYEKVSKEVEKLDNSWSTIATTMFRNMRRTSYESVQLKYIKTGDIILKDLPNFKLDGNSYNLVMIRVPVTRFYSYLDVEPSRFNDHLMKPVVLEVFKTSLSERYGSQIFELTPTLETNQTNTNYAKFNSYRNLENFLPYRMSSTLTDSRIDYGLKESDPELTHGQGNPYYITRDTTYVEPLVTFVGSRIPYNYHSKNLDSLNTDEDPATSYTANGDSTAYIDVFLVTKQNISVRIYNVVGYLNFAEPGAYACTAGVVSTVSNYTTKFIPQEVVLKYAGIHSDGTKLTEDEIQSGSVYPKSVSFLQDLTPNLFAHLFPAGIYTKTFETSSTVVDELVLGGRYRIDIKAGDN